MQLRVVVVVHEGTTTKAALTACREAATAVSDSASLCFVTCVGAPAELQALVADQCDRTLGDFTIVADVPADIAGSPALLVDHLHAVDASVPDAQTTLLVLSPAMASGPFDVAAEGGRAVLDTNAAVVWRHLASQASSNAPLVGLYPAPPSAASEHVKRPWTTLWNTSPVWAVAAGATSANITSVGPRRLVGVYPKMRRSADDADAPPPAPAASLPSLEVMPYFDPIHYPRGVNANFEGTCCALANKFTGSAGLFEGEGRELAVHADAVVTAMEGLLAASDRAPIVLELGCGTGLFTVKLSASSALGQIIATDPFPGFMDLVDDRRRQGVVRGGGATVVLQQCPTDALPDVPSSFADLCAVIDVYHHLEYPRTMMSEVGRCLKPGALLLLIDFHRDPKRHYSHTDESWIMQHVRSDQDCFETEIASCGFQKVREIAIDGIRENYVVVFRKTT